MTEKTIFNRLSVGSPYLKNKNSFFHKTFTQEEAYQDIMLYTF